MRLSLPGALLAALLLPLPACSRAPTPATPPPAAADAWWDHVTILADDSMRGRETGSAEHRKAADYVAAAFARAGLRPGGEGFLHPVRFIRRRLLEERSSLALVRGGRAEPLVFGSEATINLRGSETGGVDAPMVFVGYGLKAPDQGIDDLAGVDLRGKVAVMFSGIAPKGMAGPALAAARSAGGRAMAEAGIVGAVSIPSPRADLPWDRFAASRLHPQMRPADRPAGHAGSSFVSVSINPARAERLFTGAPRSFAEVLALADSGMPLPGFLLPANLRAMVAVEEEPAVSHNVVGLLPGSDPALRAEYVVLTAHLDHLGVAEPVNGDSIFNGAMDNASGIATLIETAGLVARRGSAPKRSVAFVAVTAEEHGLLGSDAFAEKPPLPDGRVVADLNTDMYLPINPLRKLLVNGLEESDLADDVRRAAGRMGVEVITDPEPERNAFVRSDQYSFIRRGIPSLSLKVGFALDTPEHERVLQWRRERYHGVEDEVTQPVDRQAAADFNRLYAELVWEVANRATTPAWYPTSAFRPES
jgi:hypothetical protein